MNRLSNAERARVMACICEGNSIRATERITGVTKKAVTRLGVELGEACVRFADKVMVNLPCTAIQCDEIWAFCVCYNFTRVHSALRITPAMAAGLTDHVWEISEVVALLEAEEAALCA